MKNIWLEEVNDSEGVREHRTEVANFDLCTEELNVTNEEGAQKRKLPAIKLLKCE